MLQQLQQLTHPLPLRCTQKTTAVKHAQGKILAQDMLAQHDIPAQPSASLDGYALIQTAHWPKPGEAISIAATTLAGDKTALCPEHQAIEIMTGAALDPKINTIIPYEKTQRIGPKQFISEQHHPTGQALRPRGSDVAQGQLLAQAGTRLNTAHLMHALAQQIHTVDVWQPIRMAVAFTGKEIKKPSQTPLKDTQSPNTVARYLASVLPTVDIQLVKTAYTKDSAAKLKRTVAGWLADDTIDVIVTTGGASMGKVDFVKDSMQQLGLECAFRSLNMRPGHPSAAFYNRHKSLFCLPGNPLSAICAFEHIIYPWIRHKRQQPAIIPQYAPLQSSWQPRSTDLLIRCGRLISSQDGSWQAEIIADQQSYQLSPLLHSSHWILWTPETPKQGIVSCIPRLDQQH